MAGSAGEEVRTSSAENENQDEKQSVAGLSTVTEERSSPHSVESVLSLDIATIPRPPENHDDQSLEKKKEINLDSGQKKQSGGYAYTKEKKKDSSESFVSSSRSLNKNDSKKSVSSHRSSRSQRELLTPVKNAIALATHAWNGYSTGYGGGSPEEMSALLSSAEEEELRSIFEEADADRSGYLDHAELREVLKTWSKLGPLNPNEVTILMRRYDADGSGTIDYDEFLALAAALSDDASRQEIREAIGQHMADMEAAQKNYASLEKSTRGAVLTTNDRYKVLALHGSGDNLRVTQLQIANLGLDKYFDFIFVNAPFESGPSVAEAAVEGPYYTWINEHVSIQSNIAAIRKVIIDAISRHGHFDGIFGFSMGGALALALMQRDVLERIDDQGSSLQSRNNESVMQHAENLRTRPSRRQSPQHYLASTASPAKPNKRTSRTFRTKNKKSLRFHPDKSLQDLPTVITAPYTHHLHLRPPSAELHFFDGAHDYSNTNFMHEPPFQFAIVACPSSLERIRLAFGLEPASDPSAAHGLAQARTVHIIGTRDHFKVEGELNILEHCTIYPDSSHSQLIHPCTLTQARAMNALAKYLPVGHELPRTLRNDSSIAASIFEFIQQSPVHEIPPPPHWPHQRSGQASPTAASRNDDFPRNIAAIGAPPTHNIEISDIAYARLQQDRQIMEIDLRAPPKCTNFVSMLAAAPSQHVFLRGHRRSGQAKSDGDMTRRDKHRVEVTYGDLLRCITEGAADIRASLRLDDDNVLAGVSLTAPPTLAYATPPDGPASAAAAIAFFTFASLGAAAPLEAGALESDAYDAFDQLNAATIIVWRDGNEKGIRAAALRLGARLFEATLRTKRPLDWFFDDIYSPEEDHSTFLHSIVHRCRCAYQEAYEANVPNLYKPAKLSLPRSLSSTSDGLPAEDVKYQSTEIGQESVTDALKAGPEQDHIALLLRTSGTTSKPKIVALTQSQLVTNGMALASNLELTPDDVCLNAMPLFHIGGLSASILGTLASKGSVLCISGAFNAENFAMHLGYPELDSTPTELKKVGSKVNCNAPPRSPSPADKSPHETRPGLNHGLSVSTVESNYTSDEVALPTWYSAVPTMHNAIVSYLKRYPTLSLQSPPQEAMRAKAEDQKPKMEDTSMSTDESIGTEQRCYHRIRFVRSGAAALSPYDARRLSATFGDVPVLATYSMSEQMPISQPPLRYGRRQLEEKPGTVGVAVATCLAVVTDKLEPISDDPYDIYGGTTNKKMLSSSSPASMRNLVQENTITTRRILRGPDGTIGKLGSSQQKVTPQSSRASIAHGFGQKQQRRPGQIAICGPTVMKEYLNNTSANASSFFILGGRRWFLTGDVGFLDEEGHLRLTGRSKELIKRGGEQVSPYEVEDCIIEHDYVHIAVVFAVPSALWGEEVGVAIVPNEPESLDRNDTRAWAKVIREVCTQSQLAGYKIPTHVAVVDESKLPKTKTRKFIRTNLAQLLLGISEEDVGKALDPSASLSDDLESGVGSHSHRGPPLVAPAISGARFVLVLWTMFQHIGSGRSLGKWKGTRGFNLHMPMFFALAGFQLASGMAPPPSKLFFLSRSHRTYFWARFSAVHPLYLVSILCCALVLLIGCRPNTYRQEFHVEAQKNYDKNFNWRWSVSEDGDGADVETHAFCEPTPIDIGSWTGSYISTILIYIFGLQAWPFAIPIAWFLSYYTWFQSVYYFCLFLFPFVYRQLYKVRGNTRKLLQALFLFFMLNNCVCGIYLVNFGYWSRHWRHKATLALALYLFPPFWAPYFFGGAAAAFLLDAYRPYEIQQTVRKWARIGDFTSLYFAAIVLILRLARYTISPPSTKHNKLVLRIWLYTWSRLHFPFVFFWIYALAVGGGYVARFLGTDVLAKTLGPLSFAAYLFHQVVGALYYALTRNAVWNWWRFRKFFYWFSPYPLPVPWYEAIWVMTLTVGLSKVLTDYVNPYLVSIWSTTARSIAQLRTNDKDKATTLDTVCDVIFQLTGTEVEPDNTLEQCGLASVGLPVLIRMLTTALPGLTITAADFISAQTLRELAIAIDARLAHNEAAHIM